MEGRVCSKPHLNYYAPYAMCDIALFNWPLTINAGKKQTIVKYFREIHLDKPMDSQEKTRVVAWDVC
jgi:hypothetical protein